MEKVAFITGITGQDGSYLSEFLLEKGYTVVGLVRRTVASDSAKMVNLEHVRDHQRLILEYGDMSDMASLTRIVSHYKPQEVYNLAAQSHVGTSFKTPMSTVEINLNGCLNLLEAIRIIDPKIRFYQASTSEMFGDNIKCPQNENTVLSPVSPYACAKVGAHNLVQTYRKSYNMHASSGILFNHESPRRGDWGFAGDYVEAMWLMLQQEQADDYVISSGRAHSVRDFLNYVFDHAGLDPDEYVIIDPKFYRPCEVPRLWGDSSKAKRILGWEPSVAYKELAIMMYEGDYERESKKSQTRD